MKIIVGTVFLVLLAGCECDSICDANRETKNFLNSDKTNTEIVNYLNTYIGEAPGAEKYSVFVSWGVNNTRKFVAIMNEKEVTERTINLVTYKISDMGQSNKYCKIYEQRTETENDKKIRNSILGCQHGL